MIRRISRVVFPQLRLVRQIQTTERESEVEATASADTVDTMKLIAEKDEAISALEKEVKILKSSHIDHLMEIKSMRHRAERDINDIKLLGCKKFAKDMIDVADALDMAINAVPTDTVKKLSEDGENLFKKEFKNIYEGILITRKILADSLTKNGVQSIKPIEGDSFDPTVHHAKFEIPASEHSLPPKTIGEVLRVGYSLNGQLIRPAEVGVVKYGE